MLINILTTSKLSYTVGVGIIILSLCAPGANHGARLRLTRGPATGQADANTRNMTSAYESQGQRILEA